jgi:hypothetical protein
MTSFSAQKLRSRPVDDVLIPLRQQGKKKNRCQHGVAQFGLRSFPALPSQGLSALFSWCPLPRKGSECKAQTASRADARRGFATPQTLPCGRHENSVHRPIASANRFSRAAEGFFTSLSLLQGGKKVSQR